MTQWLLRKTLSILLILASVTTLVLSKDRCTAIAVGSKATVAGGTINTHADDCFDCDFRIIRVPAANHPRGAKRGIPPMRFTYPRYVGKDRAPEFNPIHVDRKAYNWPDTNYIGYIPQVPRTLAYIDGSYAIVNEAGVALGESTCGSKLISAPIYDGGKALFEIAEVGRIALERAKTAREAISIIGELTEKYGYYSCEWKSDDKYIEGGEAYTVTDEKEAWMLHVSPDDTGASAVWVAQRIPDDHVTAVTNTFRIRVVPPPGERDPDWWMASSNIYDVAIRAGLWSGNITKDGPLDFKVHYGFAMPVYKEPYVSRRLWRIFSTVAPSLGLRGNMTSFELPLSVRAEVPITLQLIKALHRDHFEGTHYDTTRGLAAGPYGNPNRYDAYEGLDDPKQRDKVTAILKQRDSTPQVANGTLLTSSTSLTQGEKDALGDMADLVDRAQGIPLSSDQLLTGHFERTISLFRTAYTAITELRPTTLSNTSISPSSSSSSSPSSSSMLTGNATDFPRQPKPVSPLAAYRTWISLHQPKTSVFVPFYPKSPVSVPSGFSTGSLYRFTSASTWWVFSAVSNYAEKAWRYIFNDIAQERDRIESAIDVDVDRVERKVFLSSSTSPVLSATSKESKAINNSLEALGQLTEQIAQQLHKDWWALFEHLLGKYHDGYRLDEPHNPEYTATPLFYPVWWLRAIRWWRQYEGDGAKPLEKDAVYWPPGDQCTLPLAVVAAEHKQKEDIASKERVAALARRELFPTPCVCPPPATSPSTSSPSSSSSSASSSSSPSPQVVAGVTAGGRYAGASPPPCEDGSSSNSSGTASWAQLIIVAVGSAAVFMAGYFLGTRSAGGAGIPGNGGLRSQADYETIPLRIN